MDSKDFYRPWSRTTEEGHKFHYNETGLLHRLDGPAVEYSDGDLEWWVNGKNLTEGEFKRLYPAKPTEPSNNNIEVLETSLVPTKIRYNGRTYVLQEN
jgi:hypothetical protein